jgi:hypothetical protein
VFLMRFSFLDKAEQTMNDHDNLFHNKPMRPNVFAVGVYCSGCFHVMRVV